VITLAKTQQRLVDLEGLLRARDQKELAAALEEVSAEQSLVLLMFGFLHEGLARRGGRLLTRRQMVERIALLQLEQDRALLSDDPISLLLGRTDGLVDARLQGGQALPVLGIPVALLPVGPIERALSPLEIRFRASRGWSWRDWSRWASVTGPAWHVSCILTLYSHVLSGEEKRRPVAH
jgi:hypothetical protein